jgi:opacity protein-like surface antigen
MTNRFCLAILITAGFFTTPNILIAQSVVEDALKPSKEFPFRIAVDGGLNYLIGDSDPATEGLISSGNSQTEVDNFYSDLKVGVQAGASFHYLFNDNLGLGLDYRIFANSSNMTGYFYAPDNTVFYGPISEKVYINFVGPSFFYQDKMRAKKWTFLSSVAVGLAFYRDEINLVVAPALITSTSPAVYYGLGVEYSLSKKISAGISISGFYAELKNIKVDDGQTKTDIDLGKMQENLSRVNLSIGIHYRF